MGFSGSSAGKEYTCNGGNPVSISGLGRFSRGGHGNPLEPPPSMGFSRQEY